MTVLETYRGFKFYANCESSITTGNTPRELYHFHNIEVGGFKATMLRKEPVNFKAYQGGFNPVYGSTIQIIKDKIDKMFGPTCEECGKSMRVWCECNDENTDGEHESIDRDNHNYDEY